MVATRLELGVLSSGDHKVKKLAPYLQTHGVYAYRIAVDDDLPERESNSPRKVLSDKLKGFSGVAQGTILWEKRYLGKKPSAVAVLDVLGLKVDKPNTAFGNARAVYKKPTDHDPVRAASVHFRQMTNQPLEDGYFWAAKIPGAAIAPVDLRTGIVGYDEAKLRWDQALYYGLSPGLIELLSYPELIHKFIEEGLFDSRAFTCRSIGGVKEEILMKNIVPLAVMRPNDGISMQFRYKEKKWTLDSGADVKALEEIFLLADAVGANASISLASQLANDIKGMAESMVL